MNQIYDLDFIITALNEAGWNSVQTDNYWLLIPVDGEQGSFFISVYFHPDHQMLSARGNIPVYVPKDKHAKILQFINYGNYRIPVGNFEFDVDSQQVYFRVGMFFENILLNSQLLHNVVHEVYKAVQDFKSAIQSVVQDEMSLEKAFKESNSN